MRIFNIDIMHVNKLTLTSTNQILYNLTGKEFKQHVIHQSLTQSGHAFDGGDYNIQKLACIVNLIFKYIDKINTNKFISKVKKTISEAYKPRPNDKYLLGEGCFSYVYKINDSYVIKVPKHGRFYNDMDELQISDEYKDLATYAGNILVNCGKVQIMRNLGNHIPAGIPFDSTIDSSYMTKAVKYFQRRYLPAYSKVSQKSYNALARDLVSLNKRYDKTGYRHIIDYFNPNNIVLNGDKLSIVDEIEIVENNKQVQNSMIELLNVLLGSCLKYGKSLNDAKVIFKKVVKASMSENLPVSYYSFGTDLYDYHIMHFLLISLKSNANSEWVVKSLDEISNIPDKKLRLDKTNKFLDEIFSDKYAISFT